MRRKGGVATLILVRFSNWQSKLFYHARMLNYSWDTWLQVMNEYEWVLSPSFGFFATWHLETATNWALLQIPQPMDITLCFHLKPSIIQSCWALYQLIVGKLICLAVKQCVVWFYLLLRSCHNHKWQLILNNEKEEKKFSAFMRV